MIKVLSNEQIRAADKATIDAQNITSTDLMERAANACSKWIKANFDLSRPIIVLAGIGNNGGDALVISRKLMEHGHSISTFVIRYSENVSTDFQINYDRLVKQGHEVNDVFEVDEFPSIPSDAVVVDGIFGSGLNRQVEGIAAQCIEQLNASIADVVSIDLPSGMFADQAGKEENAAVTATYTLSFQSPKLSFLLPGLSQKAGEWHVLDIGLDPGFISTLSSNVFYLDSLEEFAPTFIRQKFDHKGTFGHVLVMAGSHGKMGASVMSTKAALRSGAGLVTAYVPTCGYNIIQSAVPEAMALVDDETEFISTVPSLDAYDVIAVGPGIGTNKKTKKMLKYLLAEAKVPMVLDADALNMLAEAGEGKKWLNSKCLLTPHVGEFERLFGESANAFDRLEKLKKLAQDWEVFILLKGAHSALATPSGGVYFNSTGNPGMATGGSGDVLTGLVAGLIAQCGDVQTATLCAMYIHGVAGDLAAEFNGQHGMLATDMNDNLGDAIRYSFSNEL